MFHNEGQYDKCRLIYVPAKAVKHRARA